MLLLLLLHDHMPNPHPSLLLSPSLLDVLLPAATSCGLLHDTISDMLLQVLRVLLPSVLTPW
jgi:hypothetical protein